MQQIPQVQPVIPKQEGHKVTQPPAAGRKDTLLQYAIRLEFVYFKKNKMCYLKTFLQYILIMLFPLPLSPPRSPLSYPPHFRFISVSLP